MGKTNKKKTLVITGLNKKLYSLFPAITNKEAEQLVIATSFGTVISQPYGCTMRSIILTVYSEDIEEIYIIGEQDGKEHVVDGDEIVSKILESGILKETIDIIEYVNTTGSSLSSWLAGKQDIKNVIHENVSLIKSHPLTPKTLSVYGFIANAETGEFQTVG